MKIAPISFGKTVKINAPEVAAYEAANLINNQNQEKGCKKVQKELKDIFNDTTQKGDAYVYTLPEENETFILTGKECEKAASFYEEMIDGIDEAGSYYGAGDLFQIAAETLVERFQGNMQKLINETRENFEVSITYNREKGKIKKIDILK